ncbi:nuclear pore complex protein Nup75 isoform X2 [Sitodiplosis mosellana]|uniref:nuclear pore complex protein Nup75 isoform X2 n=1 Tax=Sitodiplosis mosellana TaxID=263140 RepID=UPI0024453442|nr:nuclear pore complex protein Nup75 isoform X2 [Sitodiplosis mosellana]
MSRIPTFNIHDSLCEKTGLSAKWVNGSELSVYAFNEKRFNSADRPSEYANKYPVNIHHLKTKFIFDEPILRGFLAEANSIFQDVQSKSNATQKDFLKISHAYRSILRGCLEKLQKEVDIDAVYKDYTTIFYSIECIWHLCEIFLIDPSPSNHPVPHLIEWIRFHFPEAEQRATSLLFTNRGDEPNKEYLQVVKSLITQGHLEVARAILQLYKRTNFNACLQMTEEILRLVPIFNVGGGLSIQNWRSQWQYWLADTEAKIQMGCFESEPELKEIVELVTGNEAAWNKVASQSSCWYEHFPGYLFYTHPNCTYYELNTLAEKWLNQWSFERHCSVNDDDNNLKHLDRIVLKIMQNDFHQVLRDIQNVFDQWFATHLTDLLWHSGKLNMFNDETNEFGLSLRESLLFDFGAMLMSKESFWVFGIDYLEQCGTVGNGAIEMFISKMNIKNEKNALKLLNVIRSKRLIEAEKELCRVQARKSFNNGRYGNALDWALRSQDNLYVTAIADLFLLHYTKTGELLCEDAIQNVGAKMFISPRLVFLVKYCDFQIYHRTKQYAAATELLINLLDSKIAPAYFWPSMFADTFSLLEAADPKKHTKSCTIWKTICYRCWRI